MESKSDKVLMGKMLEEGSYPGEEKRNMIIDNLINIDIVGDDEIQEVKYSNRIKIGLAKRFIIFPFLLLSELQ